MKIAIIGAGNLGQALKVLLSRHDAQLWDKEPGKVSGQKTLQQIIEPAHVIFLAVPTRALREAIAALKPFLGSATIVATMSKGIEPGTLETVDQVLLSSLPHGQLAAHIGGPMLAAEIKIGKHAAAVVGTYHRSTYATLKKLFADSTLRLEYSRDMRGVAVAGVLKNIYTLALGIADGLELGNNTIGWLGYCAIKEMQVLMPMLGGKKSTIVSAAGIGDFIATATSPHSMNYSAGTQIGKHGSTSIASEGLIALPEIVGMVGEKSKRLPLLAALAQIIIHRHDARTTLTKFINRK
jgi:glycerol-3-phosphate dehydrogenase (NAD(P)+)